MGSASSDKKTSRPSSSPGLLSRFRPRTSLDRRSSKDSTKLPSPTVSQISAKPPVLAEIGTEIEDEESDHFDLTGRYITSNHGHIISRYRGNSVQDNRPHLGESLQIEASVSLPSNYGSELLPRTPLDEKPPSMTSFDSSGSASTYESVYSNQPPLILRAKNGSIEAGTLDGLVDQLIKESSSELSLMHSISLAGRVIL